jgi:hypothetical protein
MPNNFLHYLPLEKYFSNIQYLLPRDLIHFQAGRKIHTRILLERIKERGYSQELGVGGRITLQ